SAGHATSVIPTSPTTKPRKRRGDGIRRAKPAATIAVNKGFAPINMPVSADETRCSANGNMLRGNANQRTPSDVMRLQSDREIARRADGKDASGATPTLSRTKVTPLGPIALRASAMKRNDAPQMAPGIAMSSQSVDAVSVTESDAAAHRTVEMALEATAFVIVRRPHAQCVDNPRAAVRLRMRRTRSNRAGT